MRTKRRTKRRNKQTLRKQTLRTKRGGDKTDATKNKTKILGNTDKQLIKTNGNNRLRTKKLGTKLKTQLRKTMN